MSSRRKIGSRAAAPKSRSRYAEEREALDADLAAIETLERAAAEFALKRNREEVGIASEPSAVSDRLGDGRIADNPEDAGLAPELPPQTTLPGGSGVSSASEERGFAPQPPATTEPLGGGEGTRSLDIVKPGSRWRLHRSDPAPDPEGSPGKTDW